MAKVTAKKILKVKLVSDPMPPKNPEKRKAKNSDVHEEGNSNLRKAEF